MNVYVAAKYSHRGEAALLMHALRTQGHAITRDWTDEEDPPEDTSPETRQDFWALCAAADFDGVRTADVLILLHDPACRGAFVELGIALGLGVRVIVVGGRGNPATDCPIFVYLPDVEHVASVPEALKLLEARS
jgi:hypothetical protein